MTGTEIATVIVGALALLGTIASSIITASSTKKLMQYQISEIKEDIQRLSEKQDKHNCLIERVGVVEDSVKSAHKRLDDQKDEIKELRRNR